MDEARSFAPLLIVVMLAFLAPLLLSSVRARLAIPIVVGEKVAGMIVAEADSPGLCLTTARLTS